MTPIARRHLNLMTNHRHADNARYIGITFTNDTVKLGYEDARSPSFILTCNTTLIMSCAVVSHDNQNEDNDLRL